MSLAPAIPAGWYPRRGEVYMAQIDKLRPVIVLSVDPLNKSSLGVCIIPVTSVEHKAFSVRVPIRGREGGLDVPSWAKCDKVTTIEKADLRYPAIGALARETLSKIEERVKFFLGFAE